VALVAGWSGSLAAQQGASVAGHVTDQATGLPVSGARIVLVGTNRQVVSNEDGRYVFANLPAGQVELRVVRIGYSPQNQTVGATVGGTATLDFSLAPSAIELDQIVITATGERRNREVANNMAAIDAVKHVEEGAITTFSDLLSSRATGVIVSQSSGTTGGGTRIRIRGANSLSLSNEPLLYLDGVRVDNTAASFGTNSMSVGGQQPSRLNDINPEEIESIDIIKGPSAATLYGTEAANGVILITTKRGRAGDPRWNLYLEGGLVTDPNDYPTNFADAGGCFLILETLGQCEVTDVQSFNVLEDKDATPIGMGNRQQVGLNVSGGTEQLSYFLSGEFERELGTLRLPDSTEARVLSERGTLPSNLTRPNELERVSLRANLRSQVLPNADWQVSVGYVTSDLRLPQNDNNVLGILPSGFFGGATPELGFGFFTPDQIFAIRAEQNVERFIGSLQTNWQPFSWLTTRGAFGIDQTSQFDNDFTPTGEVPFATSIDGIRNSNRILVRQYTADIGASATARISEQLSSRSSVGAQFFQNINEGTFAFGNRLPAGSSSLASAVITQAFEATAENTTVGVFGEQQFGLNDRVFVTGGLRVDDNNAFGEQFDLVAYPKASLSWVIGEEPWFPQGHVLSSLRLRGAWGETGVQPTQNAATRFFLATAISQGGVDVVGVTDSSLGNSTLKPERSSEVEFGFDAGFLGDRVSLDVTYYHKNTENALVSRNTAPSLGTGSTQFVNLASVRNRGFEGAISAQIVQTRNALWDITLRGATIDNRVNELGEDVQPIIFGLGGNTQRHDRGFPAGAYFQNPIEGFDDANGDGIISIDEVDVGPEPEFLGTPIPKREVSVQTALTLWNRVRVSGLLDHRGGHHLFNGTEQFRCSQFFLCEEAIVAGSDLEKQAATVAQVLHPSGTFAGFIEPASFWKLREASITFFFPDTWARAMRSDRVSLTLTGRNLLTITDYTGVDPEITTAQNANFSTSDFLTQPPVRYWTARLNVSF
jgi:TonB-linked SusC/RagA family outer membrane protein